MWFWSRQTRALSAKRGLGSGDTPHIPSGVGGQGGSNHVRNIRYRLRRNRIRYIAEVRRGGRGGKIR